MTRGLGVAFLFDGHTDVQGIADEDWFEKAESVVSIAKGFRVDFPRGHAHGHAENQSAVRDSLSERLRLAPFGIHVMRIEVTRLAGMDNEVRFGDGSAQGLADGTQ